MSSIFHEIYASKLSTVFIAMPILLLVWSAVGALFHKYMRIIGTIATLLTAAVILYATVFSRGVSDKGIDLIPFSSFERAKIQPEMYRAMLMNVFLFFPLGLSLPYVLGGGIAKRILLSIVIGFLLSVAVEAIQYLFSLGLAETDDVICNSLGMAIGGCAYPLSVLWIRLIKKFRERGTPDE